MTSLSASRCRRGADGVRHAGHARRDPAVLHRHPARPPADARTARRSHRPLRRDRRRVAADATHRGAARTPCRPRSTNSRPSTYDGRARAQARRAHDRGRRATSSPSGGYDRSSGLVLAPHYSAFSVGQYLERLTRRRRATRHRRRRRRVVGHRAGVRRLPRRRPRPPARPTPTPHPGRVHRPLAAGPRSSTTATRTPTSCAPPPRPWPPGSGWPRAPMGDRLAERRPHTRAVARPRHPRDDRRLAATTRPIDRCRRVRLRVRRRPPRGAVRPRHRGPPQADAARARLRPHRLRQRRPARDGGARATDPRRVPTDRSWA